MSIYLKKMLRWSAFPALGLVIIFMVISGSLTRNFFSESFSVDFLGIYLPLIFLSVGQAIIIINGGIDISLGATLSLVNVSIIYGFEHGLGIFMACMLGLAMGAAIGILNGLSVTLLRINPIMVTLATSSVAGGIALTLRPFPGGSVPPVLVSSYQLTFFWLSVPLLSIIVTYFLWLLLKKSPMGTQLYAVGEDKFRAYTSGLRVYPIQFMSYLIGGFWAGMAGIAMTASIGTGSALVGQTLTLQSVAACVVGGIALSGGKGDVLGAILGALFFALVSNTVLGLEVTWYYQGLISGLIILLSILLTSLIRKRQAML